MGAPLGWPSAPFLLTPQRVPEEQEAGEADADLADIPVCELAAGADEVHKRQP